MDFIKQLKDQINIADVVGEYVRLRKSGSNHMGLCPFHAERSPSFSVVERKGIYHCFGCQRSGDVIKFVQEIQGVSFHEAIRTLASKFGVKLPPEFQARGGASQQGGAAAEDRLEIYYKLNRFVAQFYHEKLLSPAGKNAREYLAKRGVSEQTIKNAYIGYAPNDWAELYDFLVQKQAPLDKAEELGLIRKKEKGADQSGRAHYDLFRDRVMFPCIDTRGRVIAFGGRALGETDGPKYLNSPETPVFHKGSQLFGMFYAQKEIRAEDLCVVVEGFMDCLALQQAGIGYTVATLGTALTERQIAILKRLTRNIVLLFDGDSAGKEAQARAMELFLSEDLVVRGVTLPEEYDPDEFVRARGAEELASLLKHAPYLLDQRILDLMSQAGAHAEARARAVEQILPWIAQLSSETSRLMRIEELSNLFDVKVDALERRVNELRAQMPSKKSSARTQQQGVSRPAVTRVTKIMVPARGAQAQLVDPLDAKLVEHLIRHPKLMLTIDRAAVLEGIETEASKELASKLFDAAGTANELSSDLLEWTADAGLKALISRSLVLAERDRDAEHTAETLQTLTTEIKDLEKKLNRRGLERRKDTLRAIIMKADGSGQTTEFSKLMSEYNELVKRLDETNLRRSV